MLILLEIFFLHGLFWCAGAVLIRLALPKSRILSLKTPHWYAAYFAGLLLNCVVSFGVNQFLHVNLTLARQQIMAAGLLLLLSFFLKRPMSHLPCLRSHRTAGWSLSSIVLVMLTISIFLYLHWYNLWKPITDWDNLYYHLPFAQMISQGQFPSDLGRSYNLQNVAGYPPLYFFSLGVNFWAPITGGVAYAIPKLTAIMLNMFVCFSTYHLARMVFSLRKFWALLAVFSLCLALNEIPNLQSMQMLFFILAIYYSSIWLGPSPPKKQIRAGILSAVFWAGCYWVSYLGLVLLGLFYSALFLSRYVKVFKVRPLSHITGISLFISIAVIIALISPHFIRNIILTGNPLFPAMVNLLGGPGVTNWWLENYTINRPAHYNLLDAPHLLFRALPHSGVVITGIFSMCMARRLRPPIFLFSLFITIGFLMVWIYLLQFRFNTGWRYFYPLIPVAIIFNFVNFQEIWKRPLKASLIGLLYYPGMTLWALSASHSGKGTLITSAIFVSLLVLFIPGWPRLIEVIGKGKRKIHISSKRPYIYIIFMLILAVFAPAIYSRTYHIYVGVGKTILKGLLMVLPFAGLTAFYLRNKKSVFTSKLPQSYALFMFFVFVIAFIIPIKPQQSLFEYNMDIKPDIEWMNTNLPPEAVLITMESRLFPLHRSYIPADDVRLDTFYLEDTVASALALFAKLKITHIDHHSVFDDGWPPYDAKKRLILTSEAWLPHIDIVYRRGEQAMVIKLLY